MKPEDERNKEGQRWIRDMDRGIMNDTGRLFDSARAMGAFNNA